VIILASLGLALTGCNDNKKKPSKIDYSGFDKPLPDCGPAKPDKK
jgi:hypothetical protein